MRKGIANRLQEHPWVTKDGDDPLLSAEENTANLIEPPTEEETNNAITSNLGNVLVLVSGSILRAWMVLTHAR